MRPTKTFAAVAAMAALVLSPLTALPSHAAPEVPPEAQEILDQDERIDYLGKLGGEDDERVAQAFGMGPGPDDTMLFGTYPDSRLIQVSPDGTHEVLQDPVDAEETYIHSVNYHEATDTVYTAVGGTTPKVYRIPDGGYVIELTYGKTTPGVQRWRVATEYEGLGVVRTDAFTFVRS